MKPTLLITGGAGFIGSHVNRMLQRCGYHTVVIDNLSRGYRSAVSEGNFIVGDLLDPIFLKTVFKEHSIDAVMHFAAFIDVGESVRDPSLYYRNNVMGTLNLLNAMVEAKVTSLIFSSTAAIYGHPCQDKITEEHPCNPINPYGESKWMVEKMLRDFDKSYGLRYCSLRYFNAAGGDPHGEISHPQNRCSNLIPIILRTTVEKKGNVTVFGNDYPTKDGTCIRDYIHISDLGDAHIRALERILNGSPSSFFNLGNGQGYSVDEIIKNVEKVLGINVPKVIGDRRPGDPPFLIADSSKASCELGWKPKFGVEEIIWHAYQGMGYGKS